MASDREVVLPLDGALLAGSLTVLPHAQGVVLFAHGSGSSRFSSRNRFVAEQLREHGLATLLMDLLTSQEEDEDRRTAALRFDVGLLARRVVGAVDWLGGQAGLRSLPVGLFGASTGAAAALMAAEERPQAVAAVVSRGGRPDLAGEALPSVSAPTLLIVGAADPVVVQLNREAMKRVRGEVRLEIIPDATHLFEEPGALEEVARLAAGWLKEHLRAPA